VTRSFFGSNRGSEELLDDVVVRVEVDGDELDSDDDGDEDGVVEALSSLN
jgi:hypothetical protein